ncbi:hypothetical protein V8B97DRAFT_1563859 [Scleroderma yunnanense]
MKANAGDTKFADVTFENRQVMTAKYIAPADGASLVIRTIADNSFVVGNDIPWNSSLRLISPSASECGVLIDDGPFLHSPSREYL